MKKHLLSLLLVGATCGYVSAREAEPVNPPAPLPEGMTVIPSQGFVDTSNVEFPNGVSSIALNCTQEVMPNPDNEVKAQLYYNDFDTPAEETLTTSVDVLSWQTVSVLFKERTWVLPGVYKIVIPDGMFLCVDGTTAGGDRTGSQPVEGMTLYYEIYRGYRISPGSGTVEAIDKTILTFIDADEVVMTPKAAEIDFYMDNSNDPYGYDIEITDSDGDGKVNDVVFTFNQDGAPVKTPGVYGFSIPAGAFSYKIYGTDYATDPEDYVQHTSNEILVKYTLPHSPQPEIDPDPDYAVKSFDSFLIYIPEGMTPYFADTMGKSPLYKVGEDGEVDVTRTYIYAKADPYQEGDAFIVLRIYDPATHQLLESYTPPTDGLYCLRTVQSLIYGSWPAVVPGEDAFVGGSDKYDYYYTVSGGSIVDSLPKTGEASGEGALYNMQGIKVAEAARSASHLPKGIYIQAGGKKILVK